MNQKINYDKYGDHGEIIIICHGFLGSAENWKTIAKQLSNTYQVYCLDCRNHGKSFHHPDMGYDSLSQDVIHFCHQYKLKDIILCGHSMGGKTVIQTIINQPQLVKKCIVVDILPIKYAHHHDSILAAMNELILNEHTTRHSIDKKLSQRIESSHLRNFIQKNIQRKDNEFDWIINLDVLTKEYPKIMNAIAINEKISCPTLFIKGEKSDYITEDIYQKIAKYYINSHLKTISNAGHWVQAEAPDLFLAMMIDFIETQNNTE